MERVRRSGQRDKERVRRDDDENEKRGRYKRTRTHGEPNLTVSPSGRVRRVLAPPSRSAPREAHTVERAKRDGWVYIKEDTFKGTLRWRIQSKGGMVGAREFRWYFVGAVQVCALKKNMDDMPPNKFVVYINSRPGNTGVGFSTEDEAHNFIVDELTRSPREQAFIMGHQKNRG